MAVYEASILQELADSLYRRASRIVVVWLVGMGLLAFVFSSAAIALAEFLIASEQIGPDWLFSALLIVAGTDILLIVLGWASGTARAFELKIQAQQVLWMLELENLLRESMEDGRGKGR